MRPFEGYTTYRLLSIPRRDGGDGAQVRDPHRPHLFAALSAAHAAIARGPQKGGGFALAWLRPAGQPLQIMVGARPDLLPAGPRAAGSGHQRVLFPPGAEAEPVRDPGAALDRFAHWVVCTGMPDALWGPTPANARQGEVTRGSFDDVIAHLRSPFGWLVLAEPCSDQELAAELTDLDTRLPRLRARSASESDRVAAERAEGRYRELHRALAGGTWNVRVLVGAEDELAAHTAAALLCGASELAGQPHVLLPAPATTSLADAATAAVEHRGATSPFPATTELLSVLVRPPARELPGIRCEAPQTFDVTPEPQADSGSVLVPVGQVLDAAYAPAAPFAVPTETLNRHAFVCGATGSGKSQTVRSLLETVSRRADPISWLVIEPAKAEYARMAGRLAGHAEVVVIRPGELGAAPASLNPLEPEAGFPLQGHADLVRALFLAAFEADEPFPQVLATALTTVYTEAGWDLVSSRPRPAHRPRLHVDEPARPVPHRYPTLADLQTAARDTVERVGYGAEVTADVRGFIDVRIASLRQGAPGRFFEGGHPLDIAALLRGNVVLELEAITNDQDKAFLMGAVLIRIVEHLRLHPTGSGEALRHLTVIEEAHRLLRNATRGPAAAAVEMFASLLAEIRAYGEGIVVVEQIPSKILPDVIKNTALKIIHRLPAEDDRRAVGGTVNLQPEQSELVVALRPGVAAMAADGMDRPVLVQVEHGEARETTAGYDTAPPIAGPRSPLCAPGCWDRPCSLDSLNEAGHLARRPHLLLWVDTVTAAHVSGNPLPTPGDPVLDLVDDVDERVGRCALALAVERAVRARREHLRDYVHPADLEEAVLTAVVDLLNGEDAEPVEPLRWTAGRFRWVDIRDQLLRAAAIGATGAHPATAEWNRRGLRLAGHDPHTQLDALARSRGPATGTDAVIAGLTSASGLEDSVVTLTGGWSPDCLTVAAEACAHSTGPVVRDLRSALFPSTPPASTEVPA